MALRYVCMRMFLRIFTLASQLSSAALAEVTETRSLVEQERQPNLPLTSLPPATNPPSLDRRFQLEVWRPYGQKSLPPRRVGEKRTSSPYHRQVAPSCDPDSGIRDNPIRKLGISCCRQCPDILCDSEPGVEPLSNPPILSKTSVQGHAGEEVVNNPPLYPRPSHCYSRRPLKGFSSGGYRIHLIF